VYSYNGLKLSALYDDEMGYQPAGIAVINHEVFVYISDFANSGNLYWIDGEDISDDKIQFSTDTKIVEVNGGLYVMDRKGKGSISKVNTSAKKVAWQKAIESENPYDIVAIDGSTAWVAMYNTAEIRKISLTDGSTVSSIDTKELSAKIVE
jgi:DNA-binding beta-propeller fold protein YncE